MGVSEPPASRRVGKHGPVQRQPGPDRRLLRQSVAGAGPGQGLAGSLPPRHAPVRPLAGRPPPRPRRLARGRGGRPERLFCGTPRAIQAQLRQPPPVRAQAFLSAGPAQPPGDCRPLPETGLRPPAPALCPHPDGRPGGSAAGRAQCRHPAGPARAHHAGADVRQRPAGVGTGRPQARRAEPERGRAARHGQGQQDPAGALRPRSAHRGWAATWPAPVRRSSTARSTTPCSSRPGAAP